MKTEIKSKCCGARINYCSDRESKFFSLYQCQKCFAWYAMPQEPQFETPRTTEAWKGYNHADGRLDGKMSRYETSCALEHELNEANFRVREMDRLHIEDKQKLQQELLQVRGERDRLTLIIEDWHAKFINERDLLAKQNHKMREALEFNLKSMRTVANLVAGNERHEPNINDRCILNSCHKLIEDGESVLKSSALSSLIVLSRAEVEGWECRCRRSPILGTNAIAEFKCTKCLLLERFTK